MLSVIEGSKMCRPSPSLFRFASLRPRRVAAFALAAAMAMIVATGCQTTRGSRMVTVDGKQVPVDQVAEKEYRRGTAALDVGDRKAATAIFENVRTAYADSKWADHATVALAQMKLDDGDAASAQKMVEKLLLDRPESPAADQARYVLAMSNLAQGDTEQAAKRLDTIVEKMATPEEKKAAALKLADELYAQGQPGEAARYLSRASNLTKDPAEKTALEEKTVALIDREVAFKDVRLLKETEAKEGTLIDEVLTFKLARIYVHLRKWKEASEANAQYLERYPDGQFAAQAKELNERLLARTEVDPTAIGVVLPLSGDYKVFGQRALTALLLGAGIKTTRAELKALASKGESLEPTLIKSANGLTYYVMDSRGDVTHARNVAIALVETHHVAAIAGDILLSTSEPVALVGQEFGVPVVSLSRRDGIPDIGPWVFRIFFTTEKQARALAAIAMENLGHKRFGILYPRYKYGVEMMNAFWDEVEARRGEVTAIESYEHNDTTFTDPARGLVGRRHLESRYEFNVCRNKAKEIDSPYHRRVAMGKCGDAAPPIVDFEALFIPDGFRNVSYIVPALVAEDMLVTSDPRTVSAYKKTTKGGRVRRVRLLGGNYWNDKELEDRLGRQIDGSVLVDGFNPRSGEPRVKTFVDAFDKVHRSNPKALEAQARDAGALLSAILRGEGVPKPADRDGLRDQLAKTKDFPGVTGLLSFDPSGDSQTPPQVFKFEKGHLEVAEKLVPDATNGDG